MQGAGSSCYKGKGQGNTSRFYCNALVAAVWQLLQCWCGQGPFEVDGYCWAVVGVCSTCSCCFDTVNVSLDCSLVPHMPGCLFVSVLTQACV
jgi:hypothetical protein